jgi:hypothetical protein
MKNKTLSTQKGKHTYHIYSDDYDTTEQYERLYKQVFYLVPIILGVLFICFLLFMAVLISFIQRI